MRFGADLFGPKFSKLFRDRKIFAFEIARDRADIRAARAERLPIAPGLLTAHKLTWRVRFGAILGGVLTEIFENFPRLQHLGLEIAPRSAVPHVLQPGYDP